MSRVHRIPDSRVSTSSRRRSVILPLLVTVAGVLLGGCDSGSRSGPGQAEFTRKPAPVRVVTRRARPERPRDTVSEEHGVLAPAIAREPAPVASTSSTSRRRESLSLGSSRTERSASRSGGRRDSGERLSVLEKYLRSAARRSKTSEREAFSVETAERIDWQPIFRGIDRVRVRATRPRLMEGQALRIHLREEGIEFFTTPKSGALDTRTLKTSSFLRRFRCQAAVNAGFYRWQSRENGETDVHGLQISQGELVSEPDHRHPALLIARDNRARIERPPFDLDGVYNAVPGNDLVLQDGVVVGSQNDTHPRCCAGVSRDGDYLYLLVVDGRQGGWSHGATRRDLGNWLKRLGAWDGLNLDGGGTACMCIEENGRARVITRPIHNGRPGNERPAGSHLGVRARPLAATLSRE